MMKGKKKWLTLAAVVLTAVAPVILPAQVAAVIAAVAGVLLEAPVAVPPVAPVEDKRLFCELKACPQVASPGLQLTPSPASR